jgi:hypothetical protein
MLFPQDDFSVVQSAESIAYDVSTFPLATWQTGALSFAV